MLALTTKYAIKSLKLLSKDYPDQFIQVKALACHVDIPAPYLSKVMKALVAAGILTARRGALGGVKFCTKSRETSLYEVCCALNDPIVVEQCMLSKQACSSTKPCQFHKRWAAIRVSLLDFLKNSKL